MVHMLSFPLLAKNEVFFFVLELRTRRDLRLLILFFKLLNNFINCSQILNLISFNVPVHKLRHRQVFFKEKLCKKLVTENFAVYKFFKLYNSICENIHIFHTTESSFKTSCLKLISDLNV